MPNQSPEEIARYAIDRQLQAAGWAVLDKTAINFNVGEGQAVREYQTETGPADYVLFVDGKPVGVIEAKKETLGQNITVTEDQTADYAAANLKWVQNTGEPLPFLYEATGVLTRFTDQRDPKPRSREVFTFHRPETLREWLAVGPSLRHRLRNDMPSLDPTGLRGCQIKAITKLEASLAKAKPRALVQMATGSGKTFTAITSIYRLLKHARVKRVLFLVDTRNLGEQAEQEFIADTPTDDNRSFTSIYATQRLASSHVPADAQVCISTIQRMYSILQGREMTEGEDDSNPAEASSLLPSSFKLHPSPLPVVYNQKIPPEFFDLIVIDECHRSIYNLWQQVLDYFDAFLVGLTATPDPRALGFFKQNLVSEYTHEEAITDGVNVQGETYLIETEVTQQGGKVLKGLVEKREKLTRANRWEQQDEDEAYSARKLDTDIVNHSQIRTVIRTFKEKLPEIFPDRADADGEFQVPKTLIFAKTDSHADDIINIVREEFDEENRFCKKVTFKSDQDRKDADGKVIEGGENSKTILADFRNAYCPRIAVTVDMIATGTDVKPLECLLFMRDVKSRNYFEQMKGRGTRTLDHDTLRKVSSAAKTAKARYVLVDAIGVTRSLKTASRPPVTKPSVTFRDLAMEIVMGGSDTDTVSSLAGRLARIDRAFSREQQAAFAEKTGGISLGQLSKDLFAAIVALIRRACGLDEKLTPFADIVKRNYRDWILRKNAGQPLKPEQIAWLELIRGHVETSFHLERDDLDYAPFDAQGGLGKMHQLFGDQMDNLIDELNQALTA